MIHHWETTQPADSYDFRSARDSWREHRTTLARYLTNEEWDNATAAVQLLAGIDGLRPGEIGRPTSHAEERGMSREALEMGIIQLLDSRLERATIALERLASGPRHVKRIREELAEFEREQALDDG
jgi:hypothetical protein